MIALALRYWWLLAVAAVLAGTFAAGHRSGSVAVQSKWDVQRAEAAEAANAQVLKARAETEAIRSNYIEFKAGKERETTELEHAVAAGAKRLSVRASCPSVQPRASASGTATGTAELDADARQDYYAYRRAYAEQFATLKLCRDELVRRSSK